MEKFDLDALNELFKTAFKLDPSVETALMAGGYISIISFLITERERIDSLISLYMKEFKKLAGISELEN